MVTRPNTDKAAILGTVIGLLSGVTGPDSAGWYTALCPFHEDRHRPNLRLCATGYRCFACGASGSINELAAKLGTEAKMKPNRIEAIYDYNDERGTLLFQVVRSRPKGFRQRRPDGSGGWVWNLGGVRRVLYRLPELLIADPRQPVFLTEGEKDADALIGLGLVATTNPGGAGKWRDEYNTALARRMVIVLPDNDGPGREHAESVSRSLAGMASCTVVELPGLPEKGDVSDWIAQGGARDDLLSLVTAGPAAASEADDTAALLGDVQEFIRRYVVLSETQSVAVALWVAHTHVFEAAECTPYINVTSAEKQSGKTRLLEAVSHLVARPWFTARVTAAVLVRKIAAQCPTLLLDESDAAFRGEKEYAETLRGVLNAGWRRRGTTSICVKKGGNYDFQDFDVFSPKAIAGIGELPDTVSDRSIVITLRRRAQTEPVERLRNREAGELAAPLQERLAAWSARHLQALVDRRPEIPPELGDRAADCWEPLLAIADQAGGQWPKAAREAACALSAGGSGDNPSIGERLLGDLQRVFEERGEARLSSADILQALIEIEEAPWGDIRGKPLDARRLAKFLKPFGVTSRNLRGDEDKVVKGYLRDDFVDPWSRYIRRESATSATAATDSTLGSDATGNPVADVAAVAPVREWEAVIA